MDLLNPYVEVIAVCLILILSHFFNWVSKLFSIPSVLLLIIMGIGIHYGLNELGIATGARLMNILEVVGIVGLIMIVLEAALELELKREKLPLILKSFFLAMFSLAACIAFITWILHSFLMESIFSAMLYAVALSVVSSAIVIPSVGGLLKKRKEFLIYESTFSDILGIMIFFYLLGSVDQPSVKDVIFGITFNVGITIILSFVIGYLMVMLLDRLQSQVKLFLLIAVLVLLYAVGKLFHFSSLIMILVFGVILNNNKLFFQGKLKKLINPEALKKVQEYFHILTMESAFIVRTFFFVIFGMTLELNHMVDESTVIISIIIIAGIYLIRLLSLKIFAVKSVRPELFVSPRGLITILLFFSIPEKWQSHYFNEGILLYVILISSAIMAVALMVRGKERVFAERLNFGDWEQLDKEIDILTKGKGT
ncbi:MAG: cation:proton antiporter [Lentimicrobiaceae bacterium]|nr:cation:proton antiporter [Lentimicrobiaceae bacterium]